MTIPDNQSDDACREFENQWREGKRPTIQAHITRVADHQRPLSFRQLLDIEVQYRRQLGESPTVDEYQERYPEYETIVLQLFDSNRKDEIGSSQGTTPPKAKHDATLEPREVKLPDEFSKYRIVRLLGKGGMGSVYLAEDMQLQRQVAIKVPFIYDHKRNLVFERFWEEARAIAAIRHPNICPIYEVDEHEGTPYFVMACISGQPLSQVLAASHPMKIETVIGLTIKIAKGLAEAHHQGVIHRDLKPTNIMIDHHDEPIIMDFGLARRKRLGEKRLTSVTSGKAAVGTPAYMSPEQLQGSSDIGPRCDVYSLGCIFYELLTGQLPFTGNLLDLVMQVVSASRKPPSQHRAEIPKALDDICVRAMAREAADRYQSMDELANELSTFLFDQTSTFEFTKRISTDQLDDRSATDTLSNVTDLGDFTPMDIEDGQIGLRLLDRSSDNDRTEWVFSESDEVTIGREPSNSVQLFDERVSRQHGQITFDGSKWQYLNLGRNGSYLDDERTDRFSIEHGLVVQVGKSRIQFHLPVLEETMAG